MEVLDKVDLYVGKYFSQDYVMRQLLQFTEQEIVEMKTQFKKKSKQVKLLILLMRLNWKNKLQMLIWKLKKFL